MMIPKPVHVAFFFLCLLPVFAIAAPASPKKNGEALEVNVGAGVTINLPGEASSVSIANPDVADVQVLTPSTLMIIGRGMGETSILAVGDGNTVLLQKRIRVRLDTEPVTSALEEVLPGHAIAVKPVPDGLMLTGTVDDPRSAADAERVAARFVPQGGNVINRLNVASSSQIQLRVRVAEVRRNVSRSFGINWENAFKFMGIAVGLSQGAVLTSAGAFGTNTTRPNVNNVPSNTLNFDFGNRELDLNGFIDALAQDGLITVLAEPNLTVMSGQTAYFLAGGEFPILVPQGNGTIGIEYREFGVRLSFTPTLVNAARINLKVRPEVSELSTEGQVVLQNVTVPGLRVRRAETTVEVASGQSFAIAGLLSNNQNQSVNSFPFLGELPVLGPLFRSTNFQNNQSELVIIVTPYIVRPADPQELASPTDDLVPPTEVERLIMRRQASSDPDARPVTGTPTGVYANPSTPSAPRQDFLADQGFVLE